MASVEDIRAKLLAAKQAREDRANGKRTRKGNGDNASYAFWDIKVGESAVIRLLPDADETNDYFWRERQTIKLEFWGVNGGDMPRPETEKIEITVPCVDMFQPYTCPIIKHTNPWWPKKGEPDNEMTPFARKYYKKRVFLYQGFVVHSPFAEENLPENPIRRFTLSPQIHKVIEASLMDVRMKHNPTDFANGRDFIIRKTMQGEHNNYSTSNWDMEPRSLDETEMAAIETHGLYSLAQYRWGRVPDQAEIDLIYAMFLDSLAGKPFDMASYGHLYKPYIKDGQGGGQGGGQRPMAENFAPAAAPVAATVPTQTVTAPSVPTPTYAETTPASHAAPEATVAAPAGEATKPDTDTVLARIRARNKAQ